MSGRHGGSFGTYRLERLLGSGGMGEVWLARDRTGSTVAVKVLSAANSADQGYRRRFEREARLGAQLHHPHIVPIRAFGEIDGHLFLEMAYIEGIDLAARLRSGTMAPARAVEVITQAAEALDAAHAAGLIHRDVKPGNILEHTTGFVYLIDFGIARAADSTALTATGLVVGTLEYMAPERFTGTLDARSDIYSLACVLYEALTRHPPFSGNPAQQMHAHLMSEPPHASQAAPAVPTALDDVIARGMAKNPDNRYASAGEFAAAARAALDLPAPARPPPPILDSAAPGPSPPNRVITATGPAATHPVTHQSHASSPAPAAHSDPRRNPLGPKWISAAAGLALIAAVVLWLFTSGLDTGSGPGTSIPAQPSSSATTASGPPPFTIGGQPADPAHTVYDGSFAFTVSDVVSGVLVTAPANADRVYTIVTLTVTNISGRQQLFTIAAQRLITVDGRSVAPDATATARLHPYNGEFHQFAPGTTTTIPLAFELPDREGNKNDDMGKKKDVTPSHLILHGEPSSPGVTVPIR
ncbi:serine/threonine-protein kinase [Nocardia sp. NPDC059091]|uniref:serine/threonine-protein kinase n=1 Tax=unclassified Nocardia TaxID=2637762 RepID=UPI0036B588CA